MAQEQMYYTKDHEWLRLNGDEATMGISGHAQEALGDITFVELPKIGKTVNTHDSLIVIESVKAASDVYAPVGGTVSVVNEALGSAPELINQSAEDKGWICKLKPFDAAAVAGLMTADQYQAFLAEH